MDCTQIVSLGYFWHGNCGDEAFKCALSELFPKVDFHFISNIPGNRELIESADHLIIGGGNIIDAHFLRGLKDVQTPHSFVGIGVVEDTNLDLLDRAKTIIVRDGVSYDIISYAKCYVNLELAPDITFSMTPNPQRGKMLLHSCEPLKINPDLKTVGVFLNDCVSGNFDSSILKFIECERVKLELARFLEGLPYNVVFIPMSEIPPDDRRISFDVIGKMRKGYKYSCLPMRWHPVPCLDLTSALDFAITMRLHASIFCTIAGVPFIDLLHHDKNKAYLEGIGETELGLDYYGLNARNLSDKFDMIEDGSEKIHGRLLRKGWENKCQLEELIENVHLP